MMRLRDIPKKTLILLVRGYQKFLSPLKTKSSCIFYPTCSQYAIEALEKRGFFVGTALTVWRLLRCNPFNNHGGYDPVPEKKKGNKRADKDENNI